MTKQEHDLGGISCESSIEGQARTPITTGQLLREFNTLRVRISERIGGCPGAFAGYDDLRFDMPDLLFSARLSATLLEDSGRHHLVEYRATSVPDEAGMVGRTGRVIARGVGLTLTPGQQRDPLPFG